jgi:hypothetical protein
MRRMTVHDHSIENNDISIQFLFILQEEIHNTVTIQSNQRHKDTAQFTAHSKRHHLHYAHYTERSGPFIVYPGILPAVTAADRQAAGTDKQRFFTRYL